MTRRDAPRGQSGVVHTASTALCVLLLLSSALWTCAVPYPAPKQVKTPGDTGLRAEPDVSKLRVGVTTREEVRRALGAVAAWEGDRTFVGRWPDPGWALRTVDGCGRSGTC
jgi:hypothetical protein